MLPLPYCLRTARRQWHEDFTDQCAQLPKQVRWRTVRTAAGTQRAESYAVSQKVAPTTAKDTGSLLLKMALDAVERVRKAPQLYQYAAPADSAAPPLPPPIFTNAPALARKRSLCAETIRRHLRYLQKIGFIIARKFHGTRSDIELTINPRYLWKILPPDVENAVQNVFSDTLPSSVFATDDTKFPLIAQGNLVTEESATSVGELLAAAAPSSGAAAAERRATPSGHTGPQDPADAQPAQSRPTGHQERISAGGAAPATNRPDVITQRAYVTGFWDYARRKLYPATAFNEEQTRLTLNAIWSGVYAEFPPTLSGREWEQYHTEALQRVDLVAEWLGRNPEKYLPAPYAQLVKGRGYFDAENTRGFVATTEWLARRVAAQYQHRAEEALRKARHELRAWRLGKGPKRNLALSYSQLYHTHEKRLHVFGLPMLNRFYALVAGPSSSAITPTQTT